MIAVILAIDAGAFRSIANAEPTAHIPDATSQPAQSNQRERDLAALNRAIKSDLNSLRRLDDEALTGMLNHAESLQYLAERIDRFLESNPGDPETRRLTLAKLEAVYIACTLTGNGFERIDEEARVLSESSSPELREAAEYWKLRMRLNQVDASIAQGAKPDGSDLKAMRKFIDRHPASRRSIPFIERMVDQSLETGDEATILAMLHLMQKHHPRHPAARSLAGRFALRQSIGRKWQPTLRMPDGTPFSWDSIKGLPTVVVFWAFEHSPSLKTLGVLSSFRAEHPQNQFNIVTIAIDRDADAAVRKIGELQLNCYQIVERDAWKSKLTFDFGVRSLPLILLLDNEQKLVAIIEPREWNTGPRLTAALNQLLGLTPPGPIVPTTQSAAPQPGSAGSGS